MCDLYDILDNDINYYHHQPRTFIIIVYVKHITPQPVVIITHYKRMGYVIIHKPNSSGRECINSRCRRFDLLLFRVLAQSVAAMTAVVAIHVVAVYVVAVHVVAV